MKKLVLIIIPILLVSCSKTPEAIDLVCKQDGMQDEVLSVRIDFLNSTMAIKGNRGGENVVSLEITDNEMINREIEEKDEQKYVRELVLDRRTLRLTIMKYVEMQDKSTETILRDSGQCKLLEIPERQI